MEQLLLFEDGVLLENSFLAALGHLDLEAAAGALDRLGALYGHDPAAVARRAALAALARRLPPARDPDGAAVAALDRLLDEAAGDAELAPLRPAGTALRQGLLRALAARLAALPPAFLASGRHVAEIHAELADWPAMLEVAVAHLQRDGEHSFVRQLQAYALHRLERPGAAWDMLSLALCHTPADCRAAYAFDELAAAHRRARDNAAPEPWAHAAFDLWRGGLLAIPHLATDFEAYLQHRLEHDPAAPPRCRFLRLLFLAEAARQRQEPAAELLALRRAMQAAAPDWFADYMRVIAAGA